MPAITQAILLWEFFKLILEINLLQVDSRYTVEMSQRLTDPRLTLGYVYFAAFVI